MPESPRTQLPMTVPAAGQPPGPQPTRPVPREVHEQPVFAFNDYGIAFDYLRETSTSGHADLRREATAIGPSAVAEPGSDAAFLSLERDLLAYVYRSNRVFTSTVQRPGGRQAAAAAVEPVTLHLPPRLEYAAEGETKHLLLGGLGIDADGWRRRCLHLRISRTSFRAGLVVLHVVLGPDPAAGTAGTLNEYDCIKLAKLWENGEGVGPGQSHDLRRQIHFTHGAAPDRLTLEMLVQRVLQGDPLGEVGPLDLRAGTIQIDTPPGSSVREWPELWKALRRHSGNDPVGLAETDVLPEVRAIGGMLQGLLDFGYIEAAELGDVFAPVRIDDGMLGIHKGTLLYLTRRCRVFGLEAVRNSVGISPYLIVPNALLIHNEAQVQRAVHTAHSLAPDLGREGTQAMEVLRQTERAFQDAEMRMRDALLRNWLPNVFHYPTERWLYDHGHDSRGLSSLHGAMGNQLQQIDERLSQVRTEIEAAFQRRMGLAGVALAVVGLPLAVFQALGSWHGVKELLGGQTWATVLVAIGGPAAMALGFLLARVARQGRRRRGDSASSIATTLLARPGGKCSPLAPSCSTARWWRCRCGPGTG